MDLKLRIALVKDFEVVLKRHAIDESCYVESDILGDYLVSCLQAYVQATMDSALRPESINTHLRIVPKLQRPIPDPDEEKVT